ncbi:hypothetical protein EJB05_23322 [Eragrostis curvula]|uniref:Uncharacterized protein n=1 Tax=Eragrostis curvula TaxID=38414 RepID=A0A5J9V854_9POAL|nr:hypothetical protein EJB05_23313 [Eragrostis curvula]TVU31627.1 hypothetical protein EJB05_23322 [Eragrostis curvula]
MGKHQQALPLCMVFLTALLVVSAMHAVPAEAGRALGQVAGPGYGALIPGVTPAVPRGEPYTGRGCTKVYGCQQPPAGAP